MKIGIIAISVEHCIAIVIVVDYFKNSFLQEMGETSRKVISSNLWLCRDADNHWDKKSP